MPATLIAHPILDYLRSCGGKDAHEFHGSEALSEARDFAEKMRGQFRGLGLPVHVEQRNSRVLVSLLPE